MKPALLSLSLIAVLMTSAAAQVKVTEQESADKSQLRTDVILQTRDRQVVPMIVDAKQTKIDDATTRSESVTRVRLNDGSYLDWRASTSLATQISPEVTQITTDRVEKDRQGAVRVASRVSETTTKSATGDEYLALEYKRNASGQMELDRVVTATTQRRPDGTQLTVRNEQQRDVNGTLRPSVQVEETLASPTENEKHIVTTTKRFDHVESGFTVTTVEHATVHTDGTNIITERVISKPTSSGSRDIARIVSTETRAEDGSSQRETIEYGAPLYSSAKSSGTEPLLPNRKIVEQYVRKPDGSSELKRDVLRRDVNGDWKPVTFSTAVEEGTY